MGKKGTTPMTPSAAARIQGAEARANGGQVKAGGFAARAQGAAAHNTAPAKTTAGSTTKGGKK